MNDLRQTGQSPQDGEPSFKSEFADTQPAHHPSASTTAQPANVSAAYAQGQAIPPSPPPGPAWERTMIEQLLGQAIAEQRARRRWGIFFKIAFLILAFMVVWILIKPASKTTDGAPISSGSHTALIDVMGVIDVSSVASADRLINSLQAAFKDPGTKAIVLRINSPGGSPVQAGMVNDEIVRLRAKYPKIPVYAVVEEMCASGGYYIAAAADRIYVNQASIVGSIGVLMDSFGFTGTMEKLGVERRLMTAGENKGFLDPFSPQNPLHKAHVQGMLNEIHQQFIDKVRKGRGKRLKETPETFSGLFWSGARSVQLGLADEFGTLESVARDVIKEEDIVDFTQHDSFAEQLAKRIGVQIGQGAVKALVTGAQHEIRQGSPAMR